MRKTKANMVMGIGGEIDRDWQAEDDLRTLQRAVEVRKDSKRFAAAKKLAGQKLAELQSIQAEGKK